LFIFLLKKDFQNLSTDKACESTAHNTGFSAMLAEEYVLIDISLSAAVWVEQ
jgi:hypothetical protein